jgi:hypothetical protein
MAWKRHNSLPVLVERPASCARLVAAGSADRDPVAERERRRIERHVGLIAQVLIPHDLAGFPVGRHRAAVMARDRDDEIAPQRGAAIASVSLKVHGPHDRAAGAGADVDLVDHPQASVMYM